MKITYPRPGESGQKHRERMWAGSTHALLLSQDPRQPPSLVIENSRERLGWVLSSIFK